MKKGFFLALALTFVSFQTIAASATQSSSPNWYDDTFFHGKSFTFEFIRTLGYTYEGGADIGESIATARAIKNDDINSWYRQWFATANRINDFANTMKKERDVVAAQEAYFRASNYYRAAGFYMDSPEDREKSIAAYHDSTMAFLHAIASIPYIHPVKIPYDHTTLPGYFIESSVKTAPLLIVTTGFDGTGEELYYEVGMAAHVRGYNCLIFEGPGQGEALRQQHLYFRSDWENVVTPVINYAETLPNIDKNKIALMGVSMGGYFAPRAAAFDPRIKALIADGAIYDYGATIYNSMPQTLTGLVMTNPNEFNHMIELSMKKSIETRWFFDNAMWAFHVKTPTEVMLVVKPYTLRNVIDKIKCPTLVVNSESDMFAKTQAKQFYDQLQTTKKYLLFTKEEAAQAHVQAGATAISNEKIFHWLNGVFNFHG